MHRSGTSALAGLLDELGVYGGKDTMDASYDNPKGFYENTVVTSFNEKLLEYNNSHWGDVSDATISWQAKHLAMAKDIINNQYGTADTIYLKDPRISLLLPFWIDVLTQLDYKICHLF